MSAETRRASYGLTLLPPLRDEVPQPTTAFPGDQAQRLLTGPPTEPSGQAKHSVPWEPGTPHPLVTTKPASHSPVTPSAAERDLHVAMGGVWHTVSSPPGMSVHITHELLSSACVGRRARGHPPEAWGRNPSLAKSCRDSRSLGGQPQGETGQHGWQRPDERQVCGPKGRRRRWFSLEQRGRLG